VEEAVVVVVAGPRRTTRPQVWFLYECGVLHVPLWGVGQHEPQQTYLKDQGPGPSVHLGSGARTPQPGSSEKFTLNASRPRGVVAGTAPATGELRASCR